MSSIQAISTLFLLTSSAFGAPTPPAPAIQGSIVAGQVDIKVAGSPPITGSTVTTYLCVIALAPTQPTCDATNAAPLAGGAQPATPSAAGISTFSLASKLVAGNSVYATQVVTAGPNAGASTVSSPVVLVAAAPATTTTVTLSKASTTQQDTGVATAAIASTAPGPISGTVQFHAGAVALGGPVNLVDGSASLALPSAQLQGSDAGTVYQITATYQPGDALFAASTSAPVALTVSLGNATTTTVALQATAITSHDRDRITVTVASTAPALVGGAIQQITGNVQLMDGPTPVGAPTPLVSNNAGSVAASVDIFVGDHPNDQIRLGQLDDSNAGTAHALTAIYIPTPNNFNYARSTSAAAALTITTAPNEREHTDFIAGSSFSADGDNYSQGDLFLALNYDRTIFRPGWYSQKDFACGPNSGPRGAGTLPCGITRHPGLDFFFQARLTTIPVNTSSATVTSSSSTTAATPATTSVTSFLAAQKTAQFQAGGYMPFLFGKVPSYLHRADKTQTFFYGPVARFGFSTPSNPAGNTTSSTSTSGATTVTTPTSLGTTTTATGQLYNFWLAGMRIGTANLEYGSIHVQHYFDIGVGKFNNLQSLVCKAGAGMCLTTTTPAVVNPAVESRATLLRLNFEGYMEINTTTNSSLILGINANYGPGFFPSKPGLDIGNRAKDDLGFLIGYKFDVSQLLSALPILGNKP